MLDEIAAATANAAAAAVTIVAVVTPAVAAPAAPALVVVPAALELEPELDCCAIANCEELKVKASKIIDSFLNMKSPKKMNVHEAKYLCN